MSSSSSAGARLPNLFDQNVDAGKLPCCGVCGSGVDNRDGRAGGTTWRRHQHSANAWRCGDRRGCRRPGYDRRARLCWRVRELGLTVPAAGCGGRMSQPR
jgi:hypothetical protein